MPSSKKSSIIHYVMKGPRAIEQRLAQLERELEAATSKVASVGSHTLEEIRAERDALVAFIGRHLRAWEIAPCGPAPVV